MKRFQECNKVVKLWRYRWYLLRPFIWVSIMFNEPDQFGKSFKTRSKNVWGLTAGMMQCNMNWTYTMEEVKEKLKKYD